MSWLGNYLFSSHDERKFTVYMNEGERDQIEQWVKQYRDIETGGDLFGAWIDDRTAVVQFVLGPGERCRRTSVSFFQDIDYLSHAGSYLTQKHGLCNIGQWHSHHRLGITRPSGGDENTVWGNMPNLGLDRYIVIIATINESFWNGELTVNINPYLFEIKNGCRSGVIPGSFSFLERNSPFRMDKGIQNEVKEGAEKTNPVTIYPETETETRNAGKRPYENESDKSANKIAKTEAEDKSHRMTQSLGRNAENFGNDEGEPLEIPAGDGTGRNPEDVRNENEENGQFTISQGDSTEENQEDVSGNHDEVSEQSNIGQIDATKQYPKNVLNKVEESKESNNSQDEAAKKNQNIWNEDEVSELSNMEQGGTTDKAPDVPNKDEEFESKRSNISQDEATKKNQNIEQGGAIDRTSEEVPNKDEDSRQTKILQDEANKKNQNISNEESDQSNIAPGEAIEGNSKKDPTQEAEIRQFNTAHGDGAEQILKDITNENEESGKSNIPQQRSPNFSAQRNGSESNVQAEVAFNKNSETTTSNEATEMMDVDDNQLSTSGKQEDIEEDPSSKNVKAENLHNIDESHIMDDNDAAFNALLDSKDTSKHVTSKSPGEDNEKENDAMEINNDQLSTSDAQQHHEQDFLQNDPEGEVLTNHDDKKNGVEDGQCGESDILQKDAQSDLLQSLDEESLAHLAIKQDFYNKTDEERMKVDFKKDEDKTGKDDRGLDGNQQETFQDDTTVKNFGKHGSNNDEVEYDAALVEKVTVDEQSKMSQNDVGNNLDLEEHSTDTNKHVKTTSPGANNEKEIDGIDINDQISTSDSQEHYKHDFLQNDPEEVLSNHDDEKNEVEEGQCGQSDIVRKDDQNVLKQNSHEGFLTHLLIKQDVLNKANKERIKTDFEKDEGKTAKNIGELDGNLQETSEENTTVEIFDKHGSDKEKANTKLVSDVFGDKQPKIAHNDVGSNQDVEERTKNDFEKDEDKDGGKLDGDNGVKSNIVDATVSLSSEPTGGNRLDKNESNRRSIFDPLDISEPKTKIGTKTGNDAKENETNNEGKNSQDNKPDLPDPKLEELSKTTQVEKTHSDNGMGNEIAGDNPNQDGPGTSTIEIGKAEEEDFQNTTEEKLSQSQSEHNEKKTRGCLPFNIFKKRKRSKSQNYNEDKEKKVSIEDGEHGDIQSIGKKRKDVEVSGVDVAKKGDEKENWRSRISRKRKEKMDRKKKEKH